MIEILGVAAYFLLWIFFNLMTLSAVCASLLSCSKKYTYVLISIVALLINGMFFTFIPITIGIK